MGQHQRSGGHILAIAGSRNVHDEAKIQVTVVEPGDKLTGRLAHNREYPDHLPGRDPACARCSQAKWLDQNIAQRQQCFGPSRLARDHSLGRMPRIQRTAIDRDAVGIDELRAGQQRIRSTFGVISRTVMTA